MNEEDPVEISVLFDKVGAQTASSVDRDWSLVFSSIKT